MFRDCIGPVIRGEYIHPCHLLLLHLYHLPPPVCSEGSSLPPHRQFRLRKAPLRLRKRHVVPAAPHPAKPHLNSPYPAPHLPATPPPPLPRLALFLSWVKNTTRLTLHSPALCPSSEHVLCAARSSHAVRRRRRRRKGLAGSSFSLRFTYSPHNPGSGRRRRRRSFDLPYHRDTNFRSNLSPPSHFLFSSYIILRPVMSLMENLLSVTNYSIFPSSYSSSRPPTLHDFNSISGPIFLQLFLTLSLLPTKASLCVKGKWTL